MEQTTAGILRRCLTRLSSVKAKRTIATLVIATLTVSLAGLTAVPEPAAASAGYFYQGAPKVRCSPAPGVTVPAGTTITDKNQFNYMLNTRQIGIEFFWAGKAHPTIRFVNIYNASDCHIGPVVFAQFYKVFYPEGHGLRYFGQELQHEEGPYAIPAGYGLQFAYDGPVCSHQLDVGIGAAGAHVIGVIEDTQTSIPLCVKTTPPPPAPKQCADGQDNDGDGAIDGNDFSCSGSTDDDETNPKAACQDGVDNDGDNLIDYPQDPGCSSKQDNDESNTTQCSDGQDNDGDGATDMNDFSCSGPNDNDETNPKAQCQDGQDNDGDGKVDFPQDPGCSSRQDNDESNPAQCQDGIDNDNDGATDYPHDFSCSSPTDDDETNPKAQCQDGQDNDGDGLSDINDPGCHADGNPNNPSSYNRQDDNEYNAVSSSSSSMSSSSSSRAPQCNDGMDNDNDGATDQGDFSCSGPNDDDETNPKAQCQDGQDNDNDGLTDFPQDPGCTSKQDNDEYNQVSSSSSSSVSSSSSSSSSSSHVPQCSDGMDNDNDGAADQNDFSCSGPNDDDETNPKAACQDGYDNDNDGKVDFPQDPGCTSKQDNDEWNPASSSSSSSSSSSVSYQCSDGIDNDNDGAIDQYDFSCSGPTDNDETNPKAQCQDGMDNDYDGVSDMYDPGCHTDGNANNPNSYNRQDNDEWNPASSSSSSSSTSYQCSDGIDNDNDGATDQNDFSCSGPNDNDETNPKAACQDGYDNDGDGYTDFPYDPGCTSKQDNDEWNGYSSSSSSSTSYQCNDNYDNDHDGPIDSQDPDCHHDGNPYNPNSYQPWRLENNWNGSSSSAYSGKALRVVKDANQREAFPGDTIEFRIRVSNHANAPVNNVIVTDSFSPSDFTVRDDGGADESNGRLEWRISSLQPNETREFRYRLQIRNSVGYGRMLRNDVRTSGNLQGGGSHQDDTSISIAVLGTLPQTGNGWGSGAKQFLKPYVIKQNTGSWWGGTMQKLMGWW